MTEAAVNMPNTNISNTVDLGELNEKAWFGIGALSHSMDEWDKALVAYESALKHNPTSQKTLRALGRLLLEREQFGPAVEVFQRLVAITKHPNELSEEFLAVIAICWLGMEDIGKAAVFIQKAVEIGDEINKATLKDASNHDRKGRGEITNLEDSASVKLSSRPHSPTLWYALGVYHDRLGNEEAALDAYLAFIESELSNNRASSSDISDRSREVYYRLGVIYRLMGKLKESRDCFEFVRRQLSFCIRPSPTAQNQISGPCHVEVLMQIAMIEEAEGDLKKARMILERLLVETSSHGPMSLLFRCRNLVPKIRRSLGCLALSNPTVFDNDSSALALLLKATEEEPQDSLNWYFLGRLYLQLRQPAKAYDAYQQAVYRDGRNAAFWNSIGLLYFNIGQYRDALDALTRAVHHAPHAPSLWWNLGLLYESCHGIGSEDAREAFQKGFEYSRATNDSSMTGKFESKLKHDAEAKASSENSMDESQKNLIDQLIEMDANRFVIRLFSAFPRPQSAASISRFLTYRGQQAVHAAQGMNRRGGGLGSIPSVSSTAPGPTGYPPHFNQRIPGPPVGMRPPLKPNVYAYSNNPTQPPQFR